MLVIGARIHGDAAACQNPGSRRSFGCVALLLILSVLAGAIVELAPARADPRRTRLSRTEEIKSALVAEFDEFLEAAERRATLLGDAWGQRGALRGRGIDLTGAQYFLFQGNPIGGEHQSADGLGTVFVNADVDLRTLCHAPHGLSLFAGFVATYGTGDLSAETIGNWNTVNAFSPGDPVNRWGLAGLYLQQRILSDRLMVRVGVVNLGSAMNVSELGLEYFNLAINPNIGALYNTRNTFSYTPFGSLGSISTFQLRDDVYVAAGTVALHERFDDRARHGANFDWSGNWQSQFEVGYLLNQQPGQAGLRGAYKIGGFFGTDDLDEVSPPPALNAAKPRTGQAHGVYAAFDQVLFREDSSRVHQGLSAWANFSWNNPSVTFFPIGAGGGFVYNGLIPGRNLDVAAIGAFVTDFFDRDTALGHQTREAVIEWNYTIHLTPWLGVTPDFQYVIDPSGLGTIGDALVIGLGIGSTL